MCVVRVRERERERERVCVCWSLYLFFLSLSLSFSLSFSLTLMHSLSRSGVCSLYRMKGVTEGSKRHSDFATGMT